MSWLLNHGLSLTAWSASIGGAAAGAAKLLGWTSSDRRVVSIAEDSLAQLAKDWVCERAGLDPARITVVQSLQVPGAAFEQNWRGGQLMLNPKLLKVARGSRELGDYEQRQIAEFEAFLDEVPDQPEEIGPWLRALPSEVLLRQRRASRSWGWALSLEEWKFVFAHELAGHAQHHDALLDLGNRVVIGGGGMLVARALGASVAPWLAELLQFGAWIAHELFVTTMLGRWMERRADRAALTLGAEGGPRYFKRVVVQQLFEQMDQREDRQMASRAGWFETLESWTTTHPSFEERVELLRRA